MSVKTIYLAGKITPTYYRADGENHDWRVGIVEGATLFTTQGDFYSKYATSFMDRGFSWPITEKAVLGKHTYTGPYIIYSFDHCAAPYSHAHGADENFCEFDSKEELQMAIGFSCRGSIERSDLVFAWIDDPSCYGTIAELGYAAALKKEIVISGPKMLPELWFVYNMNTYDFHQFESPLEALQYHLDWSERAESNIALNELLASFSPIERMFWEAWDKGIPLEPQHELMGGKYRLDFAHLETKTAIELDGLEAHRTTEQIANDRRRQREIEAEGWRFIRFGGKEIYHDVDKCVEETRQFILKALND